MYSTKFGLEQLVIDGLKPLTRRVMKTQPETARHWNPKLYGTDSLYYRDERGLCQLIDKNGKVINPQYKIGEIVAVSQSYKTLYENTNDEKYLKLKATAGWNNKMFTRAELMMYFQKCVSIRAEKLQDISDEDCLREGIVQIHAIDSFYFECKERDEGFYFDTPKEAFASLIDKVGKKGDWEKNPYVWRYEFELLK